MKISFSLQLAILAMAITVLSGLSYADDVIQVDVSSILNTRSVTTYSNGKFYTWALGIDGNGGGDGYLTMTASLAKGDVNPKALPDSGKFAATAKLPAVVLNYSNADSTHNQTRYVQGAGEFTFSVPQKNYSRMFLFLTSSEGSSTLQIALTYSDATETKNFVLPDYWNDIAATDPDFCYLAHDLAKWGKQNNMTEANHHNIDALDVHPNPAKMLTGIKVQKTAPGYMVFWGATGVALPAGVAPMGRLEKNRTFGKMTVSVDGVKEARFANVPSNTSLIVYSQQGRTVARVAPSNSEVITWNLCGLGDHPVVSGVYVCVLRAGSEYKSIKVTVSR
jgi:hypothetical protein